MLFFWALIFVISLVVLVKCADWFLISAEKIGLAIGLSPFIVGVTIVGLGTSFPELITSLTATFKGVTEIAAANAIGSNIANILLVVGLAAVFGRRLTVSKSLIDLDLPLLAMGTVLLLGIVWDGKINILEAALMLLTYIIYLIYTLKHEDDTANHEEGLEILPSRQERRKHKITRKKKEIKRPKITGKDFLLIFIGVIGLVLGSRYLINSVIELSKILNIATGVIAISAVAIGTSLPELAVSVKAALQHKSEVALGNVFGSNVFNMLVVIGLPGIFKNLTLDEKTLSIGVPTLALTTLLFVISGISRRVHIWEGLFYLSLYILFIAKLFNLF